MGKKVGEQLSVLTPGGEMQVKITSIQ
jgi:transcription elongation GreA/GreB family factor